MKAVTTLFLLLLAATVQAGAPEIVETEAGISVEYTGSPAPVRGAGDSAAAAGSEKALKVRALQAQVEQLSRESAALKQLTGNETPEELALKDTLAEANGREMEAYLGEIKRLAGGSGEADATPAGEAPARAPNYRAEKKQQIRELKMLRMNPPPPAGTP